MAGPGPDSSSSASSSNKTVRFVDERSSGGSPSSGSSSNSSDSSSSNPAVEYVKNVSAKLAANDQAAAKALIKISVPQLNAQCLGGTTFLHIIAQQDNIELLKFWIATLAESPAESPAESLNSNEDAKKYLDTLDPHGNTLMHFAASNNNLKMVQYIVGLVGIDTALRLISLKNNDGNTPIDYAYSSGAVHVIAYFILLLGRDINRNDVEARTFEVANKAVMQNKLRILLTKFINREKLTPAEEKLSRQKRDELLDILLSDQALRRNQLEFFNLLKRALNSEDLLGRTFWRHKGAGIGKTPCIDRIEQEIYKIQRSLLTELVAKQVFTEAEKAFCHRKKDELLNVLLSSNNLVLLSRAIDPNEPLGKIFCGNDVGDAEESSYVSEIRREISRLEEAQKNANQLKFGGKKKGNGEGRADEEVPALDVEDEQPEQSVAPASEEQREEEQREEERESKREEEAAEEREEEEEGESEHMEEADALVIGPDEGLEPEQPAAASGGPRLPVYTIFEVAMIYALEYLLKRLVENKSLNPTEEKLCHQKRDELSEILLSTYSDKLEILQRAVNRQDPLGKIFCKHKKAGFGDTPCVTKIREKIAELAPPVAAAASSDDSVNKWKKDKSKQQEGRASSTSSPAVMYGRPSDGAAPVEDSPSTGDLYNLTFLNPRIQ